MDEALLVRAKVFSDPRPLAPDPHAQRIAFEQNSRSNARRGFRIARHFQSERPTPRAITQSFEILRWDPQISRAKIGVRFERLMDLLTVRLRVLQSVSPIVPRSYPTNKSKMLVSCELSAR